MILDEVRREKAIAKEAIPEHLKINLGTRPLPMVRTPPVSVEGRLTRPAEVS